MSLKDYFEQGRQQERDHARKVKARTPQRRMGKKPSMFSPANIIIGAGVLYEMIVPKLKRGGNQQKPSEQKEGIIGPITRSIKGDIQTIIRRIRSVNPDWEDYQRFLELARRK